MAVGASLVLDLFAAAGYSGGGVSPARVLGPAIVFHCHWNTAWVYMLGGAVQRLEISIFPDWPGAWHQESDHDACRAAGRGRMLLGIHVTWSQLSCGVCCMHLG